jgi:large subunit ribosomal protein L4
MPEVTVVDQTNKKVGKHTLNDAVFGLEPDSGFLHRVYTELASARRSGTHSVKSRGEVSGGGRKPWKQKGTGRARSGSTRSALWRHGGIAHGPNPHGYDSRINKKERRRAICLALSGHVRAGSLTVVDKLEFETIKTKDFVRLQDSLEARNGLFVLGEESRELMLSGRNVPNTKIVLDGQLNLHDLLRYDRLVLTRTAAGKLEERLA